MVEDENDEHTFDAIYERMSDWILESQMLIGEGKIREKSVVLVMWVKGILPNLGFKWPTALSSRREVLRLAQPNFES